MSFTHDSPASGASSPLSTASSPHPITPVSPSARAAPFSTTPLTSNPSGNRANTVNKPSTSGTASTKSDRDKRKPSRRPSTAERRATHNAVERARRETLNGRFLDLASLLPNLSQIRRPSKSSIVNSSIAYIHASRRHRVLASRELRLLKVETDALRREVNEWRDRAGIQRVEEPIRGEGFGMVLEGELEVLPVPLDAGEDEGVYEDDEVYAGYSAPMQPQPPQMVPQRPPSLPHPHPHPQQTPMIASPQPSMPMYESQIQGMENMQMMGYPSQHVYHDQAQKPFVDPTQAYFMQQAQAQVQVARSRSGSIASINSAGSSAASHLSRSANGSPSHFNEVGYGQEWMHQGMASMAGMNGQAFAIRMALLLQNETQKSAEYLSYLCVE
ncbi:hypothetical protein VKT23_012973 [Stygiomarasmius scandens]|uniref:BHLH domain-containing protein n=1 Tax=Marasmiellus scandens TaxID=2682957 RepID=A0ABR1J826_9AGAR